MGLITTLLKIRRGAPACAPSEKHERRPGAQLRMGVVTQIGDLDNNSKGCHYNDMERLREC